MVKSSGVVRGNLCSRMPFASGAFPTFGLHGEQKHGIRVDGDTPVALGNVTMRHAGAGLLYVSGAILGNNQSVDDGGGASRPVTAADGQPDRSAPTVS